MSSPPQIYTMPPLSPTPDSPILADSHPLPSLLPSSAFPPVESGGTARIPRPCNPFMLFRSHFLKTNQIPADKERRQHHISCIVGECWNMLPEDEKDIWRRRAEETKHAHKARHPNYQYRRAARGTKPTKKPRAKKPHDEAAARERKEQTRWLREMLTPYKGEAVPSLRKIQQLTRATRTKKGSATATTSTSDPAATTETASSSFAPTGSALFAPFPIPAVSGTFVPSSTRLAPAPSTGPQITRIAQSPPLTPFHPNDRQPQLQLPEITLRNPFVQHEVFHPEREFWQESGMGDISLFQGNVYPPMGANNASAYFEPRNYNMNVSMPVPDFDYSRARSQSWDVNMMGNNMNTNANHYLDHSRSRAHSLDIGMGMNATNYLDYHTNYPAFSAHDSINNFMGNYRDAPQTPSDTTDAFGFSPAAPPLSPAWSSHPHTPSVFSSSQPQTPLTLTLAAPYHDYDHDYDHHPGQLGFNDQQFQNQNQNQAQAEFFHGYEHKFGQEGLELLQPGFGGDPAGDFSATAGGQMAYNAQGDGSWAQELGAGGLDIELGTMLHF